MMANILFQCGDRSALFTEAKRILAPGGRIVLIDWIPSNAPLGPKFESCVSEEEAKRLAIENGLRVTEEISAGETHYGFILELI
jgi:SAM-dependent methyltransferase